MDVILTFFISYFKNNAMTAENTKIFWEKVLDLQRIVKCPIHGNTHILAANVALLKSLEEYNGAIRGNFVTFSAWIKEKESYTGDRNYVFY